MKIFLIFFDSHTIPIFYSYFTHFATDHDLIIIFLFFLFIFLF